MQLTHDFYATRFLCRGGKTSCVVIYSIVVFIFTFNKTNVTFIKKRFCTKTFVWARALEQIQRVYVT
jgi:hypothetical protein